MIVADVGNIRKPRLNIWPNTREIFHSILHGPFMANYTEAQLLMIFPKQPKWRKGISTKATDHNEFTKDENSNSQH